MPRTVCESQQCSASPVRGTLTLQTRGSRFTKFQVLRLQELPEEVPGGSVPNGLDVHCHEALCDLCQGGAAVEVTGIFLPIPIRSGSSSLINQTYLEAQRIVVIGDEIAGDAREEFTTRSYEALAESIAPEIFGMLDVKKSLLLQLFGSPTHMAEGKSVIRGDINVCLMGDPGVAKSQLLKWVARAAPRGIYTTGRGSSGVGLTAAVVKDQVSGELLLESGALVLADGGVCCLDEFDKMDEDDRTAIYEVMEQQQVSIAKAGIVTTLNARTAILAAANPLQSRFNLEKTLIQNINLPAALLSRFDLLFLLLDRTTEDQDRELARHMAAVHAGEAFGQGIRAAELRLRVLTANSVSPAIPEELKERLVSAYVERRQVAAMERPTPRWLMALIRLSRARARVDGRGMVSDADVEEALRLVEASKESVELRKVERERVDMTSAIYRAITDMRKEGQEEVQLDFLVRNLRQMYPLERIMEVVRRYDQLGIWLADDKVLTWL